jgi:hypothetical protein
VAPGGACGAARHRDDARRPRPRGAVEGRRRWTSTAALGAAALVAIVLQWALASPVVGLVATALVAATVAAAAPPVVQTIATRAEPWLRRIGNASGHLAATGLRDHPRRVGLTTATIAVGIAAVAWLWILARSFEGSVVDALGRAIRADLVVTSTNIGSGSSRRRSAARWWTPSAPCPACGPPRVGARSSGRTAAT